MLTDMNPKFLLLIGTFLMLQFALSGQDSCVVNGGVLTFENQDTVISLCVENPNDSFNVLLEGADGDSLIWVLTDQNNHILSMPAGQPFNLGITEPGVCYLWNLSVQDSILGLQVGNAIDSLEGCYDLSNPIAIIKAENLVGGSILAADSTTSIFYCHGSEEATAINIMVNGKSGPLSTWLVTDTSFNILEVSNAPPLDLSGISEESMRIWHVSHEVGTDGMDRGANAQDIKGCFALSNYIEVFKTFLPAAQIYTRDSLVNVSFCSGDASLDSVEVILEEGEGMNHSWVITDTEGLIIDIPEDSPFNLSDSELSICNIYAVTYNDSLEGLEIGNDLTDIQGCHGISNSVTIQKSGVDGGRIYLPGNQTEALICLDDNLTELKFASVSGATGSNSAWLITNTDGYITDLPKAPPFSFENEPADTCLIWHMSYEGTVGNLAKGNHTELLEGCYDLSNLIAIIKAEVEPGMIWLRDSTRNTSFCSFTRDSSAVDVFWDEGHGENQAWIITDEEGVILQMPDAPPFDFSSSSIGLRYIYLMTYSGMIDGFDKGHSIEDIEGCYTLSDPITVNPNGGAEAGFIFTRDTITEVTICVEEDFSDEIDVTIVNASTAEELWLITDEEGTILKVPDGPPFSFEGAGPGTCYIHYVQYIDSLDGAEVGNSLEDISGCYDISNGIRVDRKVNACQAAHLLEYGQADNVGSGWITIELENYYESMVVVATPVVKNIFSKPVVTRVRNASGDSFELSVQIPGVENTPAVYQVQYVVAEEGVYKEELDGVKMEVRKMSSTKTSAKAAWFLEKRGYHNNYVNPVVLGQVMTNNDARWSVFWASGRRKLLPPSSFSLSATKHVGEDAVTQRSDEMLGVIIIEAGQYDLKGISFEANVTPKVIRGIEETNLGFIQETRISDIKGGVLSSFGMRGSNFGWPVYVGEKPLNGKSFHLAIDEDQINDLERRHPKEEVAYLMIGEGTGSPIIEENIEENRVAIPKDVDLDLKLYPNPAGSRFTIEVIASQSERAVFRVLDIRGQIVEQWTDRLIAGQNRIEKEQHKLRSGIYSVMILTESGHTTQRKINIIQ